jgi:predicted N-formylglutamate amidohydrolase
LTTGTGLVLSAEHATASIPERYQALFAAAGDALRSHEGWDPGSAELGDWLARSFHVSVHLAKVSRLLVDCNRSPQHPRLFSHYSRPLNRSSREQILADYYWPFRRAVRAAIDQSLQRHERVLHLSVHSFTPILNQQERKTEIGLLFDPGRPLERSFCHDWQKRLRTRIGVRVRRNYPYRGISDGHVTALRRVFPDDRYLGVEIEINQRLIEPESRPWRILMGEIEATLRDALAAMDAGFLRRQ